MLQHPFEPFFPFKEIREQQRQALEFALEAFLNQGKRVVVAELGTGCGKSAMAICIARYLQAHGGKTTDTVGQTTSGAYILTTQKVLQDHPESGKAHFVEAELLAKQGRYASAEAELNNADRLAQGIGECGFESVDGLAVDFCRQACVVTEDVNHHRHVDIAGLENRLAVVESF